MNIESKRLEMDGMSMLQQSQPSQSSLVVMKEKPEWDFDAFCLSKDLSVFIRY